MSRTRTTTTAKPTTTRRRRRKPPAAAGVTVRMYCAGLGDCFLLSFPRPRKTPFHMLIDCGVLLGTQDQNERMVEIAEDLADRTGGHLDLVVATHEHWDHLSGFLQAADTFASIRIERLWLAWTEDPSDAQAKALRGVRARVVAALDAARARAAIGAAATPALAALADRLDSLLGFYGPLTPAASGSTRRTTEAALEQLRGWAESISYRQPGEPPVALPGVSGPRIFVLGPPRDDALLHRSDPTKKGREVYELGQSLGLESALLAALGDDDGSRPGSSAPFDRMFMHSFEDVKNNPARFEFFHRHYGFDDDDAAANLKQDWRRIGGDWLGAAGSLALKLDNDTNNTSLALAIELEPNGPVLLFPGDAQVGNWLSWDDLNWSLDNGRSTVDIADLLARTVVYKVGHHASHNATLRAQGLERMTSPELVALVPVDERQARDKKKWDMPFEPLRARLVQRTLGRLLRADRTQADLQKNPGAGLTDIQWKAFLKRLTFTPSRVDPDRLLAVEYRLG